MASRKLTSKQVSQLADDYKSGINVPALSKQYDICTWSICNYLEKAGVPRRTSSESLEKLTESQQSDVVGLYQNGNSLEECAKIYSVSRETISRIVKKHITIRLIRHKFDENFFEIIDTSTKAYWFGFLCADGYAKKSGSNYHVIINLKADDIDHLEKFKRVLESDHKIKSITKESPFGNFPSVRLEISSKKMVEDLHKNGLYRFKDECIVPLLPNNFQSHFWRGFMDGDGWICFYKNKRDRKGKQRNWPRAIIGFCGDEQTMKKLRDVLVAKCGANNNKVIPDGTISRIQYAGLTQVLKIAGWLYKDSDIGTILARKYTTYRLISEYKRAKTT